jgi:hypothetical protein
MTGWWRNWWAGLRGRAAALPGSPAAPCVDGDDGAPAAEEAGDTGGALLAWLLHSAAPRAGGIDAAESRAVARLDALLGAAHTPTELLPRAPAVIPQLLSLLRQGDASLPAMSQRVMQDYRLTAEVLRQAGSAAYRAQGAAAADVEQALALLGTDGLKAVIARVVLRPLFAGQAGRLSALATARVWAHAEREAHCAAALAAEQGLDRFDGYLGGLVHGTGWIVAFRELDRLEPPLALPFSRRFVELLLPRKDLLFGKVVGSWQLSPALNALCADASQSQLAQARSPLGAVLVQAQREAALQLLRGSVAAE